MDRESWLEKAKTSLRLAAEKNNPDDARILCYTNRCLESLVPHARRAVHGEMADQMNVLPGEVLISRRAVMTPATLEGNKCEEEPGIIFGTNTEMVVEDVHQDVFNFSDLDVENNLKFSMEDIKTIVAKVSLGKTESSIRLMPEVGSNSRLVLDNLMEELCERARTSTKKEARIFWRGFFFLRDSFAHVGPASVLTVHRSQGSTFNDVFIASDVFSSKDYLLRKQLAYVAISRASRSVWISGNKSLNSVNDPWRTNLLTEKN